MRLFDDIGMFIKQLRVYAFGKGFMMLATFAAYAAMPLLGNWVLPVVAIGGVLLTTVNRFYREGLVMDRMVGLYRDDIAGSLGIQPNQVTRAHLLEAAKTNDVIGQALKHERQKTWLAIGMAVLSSAVTVGLVGGLHAVEAIQGLFKGSSFGAVAGWISVGTISSISGLLIKTVLQEAIGLKSGLYDHAAHDRIAEMDIDVKRGRPVTPEQVYTVMANANPVLKKTIKQRYGESYDHMTGIERAQVLQSIGIAPQMQALADDINAHRIRPGKLAYLVDEAHDAERGERPPVRAPEAEAANPRGNFVDRLGLAPRTQASFSEQVDSQRAAVEPRGIA